ncbi:MAG: hypothetical protein KDB27_29480 [Planctomycetales bacterium]|nr:hypothetical protein [Planctomycetales bacterium]
MAKSKDQVNKSQAVREALEKSETGSPSEIVATLAEQGITVSPAFVSNIKSQEKKRRIAARTPNLDIATLLNGVAATPTSPVSSKELESASRLIMQAVDLVVNAGPNQARELLAVAEQIVQTIRR